jgi:hypothetical protein
MEKSTVQLGNSGNGSGINQMPSCGIVMPISSIDEYTAEHWLDVRKILEEVITEAGFKPNLVSNTNEVAVIQKTIIQNLYQNEIVVCDVSGRNPNVMFELGIRLCFDKPTVIIKDFNTPYNFDTSPIEHLTYPTDLRYNKIIQFRNELKSKLQATYQKSKDDSNYSAFLKSFGNFVVPKLEEKTLPKDEFLLAMLQEIKSDMQFLKNPVPKEGSINLTELERKVSPLPASLFKREVVKFLSENGNSLLEIINNEENSRLLYRYMKRSFPHLDQNQLSIYLKTLGHEIMVDQATEVLKKSLDK